MSARILNKDFQHPGDSRYQIEAFGYYPVSGGRKIVQVIDNKAIQAIPRNFNADAADSKLPNGQEMLIDAEHFKYDQDKPTTAYGWSPQLEPRKGDGIYAEIRWTGTGQKAVDGGDYRFFSTEYDPRDMETVAPADVPLVIRDKYPGYTFLRPLKLDGLTLTNMNNNRGQKPITNRASATMNTAADGSNQPVLNLQGLEAWFAAVKQVLDTAGRTGQQMLTFQQAWTFCKVQFPELYNAAFGTGGDDDNTETFSAGDAAAASQQAGIIANRISKISGKPFDFGWKFIHEELPLLFNRMAPPSGRVLNRRSQRIAQITTPRAAAIFNRLMHAKMILNRLSDQAATAAVAKEHPGLFGLASGRFTGSDALATEPGLLKLMS